MGSGTPPWLHHAGPTMVARAWPRPYPRQLEDLQRPSTSSLCFSFVSVTLWWMDGCGDRRRQRQYIEEHVVQRERERAQNRPGRLAWADRPRPVSAPSCSPMLLGQLLTCSLLHVGPWRRLLHGLDRAPYRASFNIFSSGPWRPRPVSAPSRSPMLLGRLLTCSLLHVGPWRRLLHGLDRAPCRASFNIFSSGPWSFTTSCFGPWAIWSHVHHVSWLLPGFMIFS
jgi:hypothetical protein